MPSNKPVVKARITLKHGGLKSHTARGRKLASGESYTTTNPADILYYTSTGFHDVEYIQGAQPIEPEPEAEPESTEEATGEPEPEEGAPEPDGEQEDGPAADDDGQSEGAEEGEPAVDAPTLEPYNRADLLKMSKRQLIERAEADGLDVALKQSMKQADIIDAMIAANPANQEG